MHDRVFDAHTHAFPDSVAPAAMKSLVAEALWFPIKNYHDGTISGLLASMDRAGVERAIMCGVATRPSQVPKITDWCASVASQRIIPFASIHPDFDDVEQEAERIATLRIPGLKFHPQYMNCAIDDPRTIRIAKAAAKAGLAMSFHCGYDLGFAKDELARPPAPAPSTRPCPICASWPATWAAGNAGRRSSISSSAGPSISRQASPSASAHSPCWSSILEKHPREHILFGTDSPWADQSAEIEAFLKLPLSDEFRRAAMWTNAHRYLGIEPPPES